ncbi:hypothetical protein [Williamsia phyllosphaerae]|uniref:GAP family protein n=1 Tax=Williamsia phyllosphaerae TaxID=885042 RepID=A0ABQ1V9D3_9NOCA|nr:hypothetical protein [Williamsia phyllosphaerae]GGF42135.1 hypothetical protein GCM10007298_42320 [Williamsia phyllosphaerae]
MTITAVSLLVALAVLPAALHPIARTHRVTPVLFAASVTLVLLAVTAVVAGIAGPADGVGARIAQCAAVIAAMTGGGAVVRSVLILGGVDPWRSDTPMSTDESMSPVSATPDDPDSAEPLAAPPLRGGRVIGFLERGAVAVTLILGWPEGLAIILAVKGLARYPELREAHAGEQFIIGTFGSVLYAVAVAGTAHLIVS